eukprot:CAMPEP_0203678846 /NCGR_PEP_ID=MMETSP0090-20130426/33461_1 /ASSEMBLY_ACC=CAM_ASM_001088 /TAXON_ID=426623 /ORGANISM="Chaetoceros affinis, Strain CCMP159" /LENGTH=95 /DNA_ID=CAMNT_0050546265 /DNA_START=50 /DNA_END=337 /DNA_ORIENTATION=+
MTSTKEKETKTREGGSGSQNVFNLPFARSMNNLLLRNGGGLNPTTTAMEERQDNSRNESRGQHSERHLRDSNKSLEGDKQIEKDVYSIDPLYFYE